MKVLLAKLWFAATGLVVIAELIYLGGWIVIAAAAFLAITIWATDVLMMSKLPGDKR